jgi:hypothetical protein
LKVSCTILKKMNHQEWLEADGLGGFVSGTVSGIRTRRITRYFSRRQGRHPVDWCSSTGLTHR